MSGAEARVEMLVRRMEPRDAEAVHGLAAHLPEAAQWTAEDYLRVSRGNYDCWVARAGMELVGFLIARGMGDEMEILNMGVSPAHRRGGVGSRLLDTALAGAEQRGALQAFLEVRASNRGAVAFYERAGFRRTGLRRGYYDAGKEDAVVMRRGLRVQS